MKTLYIYYSDGTSETFRTKSLEKAKGILSRRGGIGYAIFGGNVIQGNKPKQKEDLINKAIQDGDLEAFSKLTGIK